METKFEGICLARNENFIPRQIDFRSGDCFKYPSMDPLRYAIAKYHNVSDKNVILGAGIKGVFQTVCVYLNKIGIRELECSFPYLGSLYTMASYGVKRVKYSKLAKLAVNPSNPYGKYTFLGRDGSISIYDEAYAEYEMPYVSMIGKESEKLIVMRTFSKAHGLASIRVGYAIVTDDLAEGLREVEGDYTLSSYSASIAESAIMDDSYLKTSIKRNLESRDYLEHNLAELGFEIISVAGNFIVANVHDVKGFAVRDLLPYGTNFKRITTHNLSIMKDYIEGLRK